MIKIKKEYCPGKNNGATYDGHCNDCGIVFSCNSGDLSSTQGYWVGGEYRTMAFCRCPKCENVKLMEHRGKRITETIGMTLVCLALASLGAYLVFWS